MVKITIAAVTVSVLVLSGMTAFSQDNDKARNQVSESEQDKSPSVALQENARQAYIDPVTGKLTSTPPASAVIESNRVVQANNKDVKPVEVINHPNGMVQINLNGNGMSSMKVSLDCNGQVVAEHAKKTASDNVDCQVEK